MHHKKQPRMFWYSLILFLFVASCSGEPGIIVDIGLWPTGASRLRIRTTLGGEAGIPQYISAQQTRFVIYIPEGTSGVLDVQIQAFSRLCAFAQAEFQHQLGSALRRVDSIDVKMEALAPSPSNCIQCLDSGDCSKQQVCDLGRNLCVNCISEQDCLPSAHCYIDPSMDSTKNQCVKCTKTADCIGSPGGSACYVNLSNVLMNQCVPCQGNADCIGIVGNPACFFNAINPANSQCVPCVLNSDCPAATPTCKTNSSFPQNNLCLICLSDQDCPSTRPSCYKDPGGDDRKNYCTECQSNANCKSPFPYCSIDVNPARNACIQCAKDADCSGVNKKCYVDSTDKHLNSCVPCLANADCSGGNPLCYTPSGMPSKIACVQCLQNADCLSPKTCDLMTHTCK